MRKIIFTTVLAAFALGFACSCAPKGPKQIGLQLYSLRKEIQQDLNASLDAVAAAGYTFVEMANYNAAEGKFYGMEPEAFTELCNAKQLNVLSSHINGPDPNTATWEECMQWWDKAIADHQRAGVVYIVQPSLSRTAYESVDGLAKYCELFNAVGAKCAQAGILFGYHNHNREFTTEFDGQRMYDYMLQHTDPNNVFFQIDVYWSQVGGAVTTEYFDKYPGRFLLWHVKDEKEIGASGTIDFKALYEKAELSGMQFGVVEQEAFDLPPFESIKASHDFLQNAKYVK